MFWNFSNLVFALKVLYISYIIYISAIARGRFINLWRQIIELEQILNDKGTVSVILSDTSMQR